MQTETQKDLRIDLEKTIDQIIMEISSGIEITSENIDEWNNDGQYELGDKVSGLDYLENILEIEYRVNNKLEYRSAEILLARGEINIRIDTNAKKVFGEYDWDYYEAFYTKDAMDIDDACSEMFLNCLP